ncbi:MAG: DUF4349 domain-containing protein [Planctomycetes bacterium]|nr:DUF4349 domain-containing protein [Planctomycetota bacterium]
MRSHLATCAIILGFAFLTGCGGARSPEAADFKPAAKEGGQDAAPAGKAQAAGDVAKPIPTPAERKIIYTGTLDIVVTNMDEVLPQVEKLVAAQKGYVAKSEVKEDTGRRRTATFSLRIPVDSFQGAREGLIALGTAERNAVDSQDVTDEFADVQGWIKNYKEEEDKLNVLMREKRKDEKLEDILKLSKRIEEVRRDIDQMQGRLNRLVNRTELATINLTLREVKDYKPPTSPTFGNRISSTFAESWDSLLQFGQWVVLTVVALTPWLVVLVPLGIVGAFGVRRTTRSSRTSTRPTPPPAGSTASSS